MSLPNSTQAAHQEDERTPGLVWSRAWALGFWWFGKQAPHNSHHHPLPSRPSSFTVPTMATTETKPAAKDDAAPLLDVLEEDDEFEVRGCQGKIGVGSGSAGGGQGNPPCVHRGQPLLLNESPFFSSRLTLFRRYLSLSLTAEQEFADPDWDAAVDEAQDEQQWQVRVQGQGLSLKLSRERRRALYFFPLTRRLIVFYGGEIITAACFYPGMNSLFGGCECYRTGYVYARSPR